VIRQGQIVALEMTEEMTGNDHIIKTVIGIVAAISDFTSSSLFVLTQPTERKETKYWKQIE
jgi:hypothetical protein